MLPVYARYQRRCVEPMTRAFASFPMEPLTSNPLGHALRVH